MQVNFRVFEEKKIVLKFQTEQCESFFFCRRCTPFINKIFKNKLPRDRRRAFQGWHNIHYTVWTWRHIPSRYCYNNILSVVFVLLLLLREAFVALVPLPLGLSSCLLGGPPLPTPTWDLGLRFQVYDRKGSKEGGVTLLLVRFPASTTRQQEQISSGQDSKNGVKLLTGSWTMWDYWSCNVYGWIIFSDLRCTETHGIVNC